MKSAPKNNTFTQPQVLQQQKVVIQDNLIDLGNFNLIDICKTNSQPIAQP